MSKHTLTIRAALSAAVEEAGLHVDTYLLDHLAADTVESALEIATPHVAKHRDDTPAGVARSEYRTEAAAMYPEFSHRACHGAGVKL
jgi:hypothetical protein